jgi:hypothetical protein
LPTAAFNAPDQTDVGLFCKAHATEGMVDVKKQTVRASKLRKNADPHALPLHGDQTGVGLFCKAHATDWMVDVISKR